MTQYGSSGFEEPEQIDFSQMVRHFWIKVGSVMRVMFVGVNEEGNVQPFNVYVHNLWQWNGERDNILCPNKSKLDDPRCPICTQSKKNWARFIGNFTVIDMGEVINQDGDIRLEGWTSDRGVTYQFGKKLYVAKFGSKDKPGTYQKLTRESNKHKGLAYTVWDIYRGGAKDPSVGSEFEFVCKLDSEEEALAYLAEWGCNIDSEDFAGLGELDYHDVYEPWDYKQILNLVEAKMGRNNHNSQNDVATDDDIPF